MGCEAAPLSQGPSALIAAFGSDYRIARGLLPVLLAPQLLLLFVMECPGDKAALLVAL